MEVYSDFFYYSTGVYHYTTGTYEGGHVILIVGYDDVNQYFICKNSWGTGWGERGFFRIAYSELNSVTQFGDYTIAYQDGSSTFLYLHGISADERNLSRFRRQRQCHRNGRHWLQLDCICRLSRLDHDHLGRKWFRERHGGLHGHP